MNRISAVVGCGLLAAASALHAAPNGAYAGSTSSFTLTQRTDVPGATLKPGEYKIQVLDQLSDRMIVRVDSANGKDHLIFLGVPHADLDAAAPGAVTWKTGPQGATAMRGFEFAPGTTVEFVYPKAEAAALAKANVAKVVAVDPESEGRPALKKMSQDDMQVVTLWSLSLTTAGPEGNTPAILAEKYEPGTGGNSTVVARNNSIPYANTQQASAQAPPEIGRPAKRQQHVASQLPHTASSFPLVWMLGLLSLLAAAAVRMVRVAAKSSPRP